MIFFLAYLAGKKEEERITLRKSRDLAVESGVLSDTLLGTFSDILFGNLDGICSVRHNLIEGWQLRPGSA